VFIAVTAVPPVVVVAMANAARVTEVGKLAMMGLPLESTGHGVITPAALCRKQIA
jgi:hypothetical protein